MYIPSELGYGESGSPPKIQGGDALVFVMEIIKINGDKVPASRCDPSDNKGCNEMEIKYIEKIKSSADTERLSAVRPWMHVVHMPAVYTVADQARVPAFVMRNSSWRRLP